jgi:hypothetical protein
MFLTGFLTVLMLAVQVATPATKPSPLIPESCAVTLPNGVDPASVEPPGHWYGRDGLHVGISPDGIYHAKQEPGQPGGWNKHIWVDEVVGRPLAIELTFNGERTTTGESRAVPSPSSPVMTIWFPEGGCWTITGTTSDVTIAVTVWVVFVDDWLTTPAA